jgi:alkylation response protein AidB-like acyl-CoA dehydrogenase
MNFDHDQQEKNLSEKISALIGAGELPALEAAEDWQPAEIEKALRAWLKGLAETGYLAAGVGKDQAGQMLGLLIAQKELAKVSQWLVLAADTGARLVGGLVADHGTDSLKANYLKPLSQGDLICALAVSEPSSGSQPAALTTEAKPDGDDYVLNGNKAPVNLAPMADIICIAAQTEEGPALFLVERAAKGVEIGERVRSLGYEALCTSSVTLTDVRVSKQAMLGPFSDSDILGEIRAGYDRILIAVSLGIIWRCFDEAKQAADLPRNSAKPPAGYQMVRFTLSEMLTLGQTAELLAYRAAAARAQGDRGAEALALTAKVFATETACTVSEQAMQILAASGYIKPNPVEQAFRNARLGPIVGHTSEVARMAIADDVLKTLVR